VSDSHELIGKTLGCSFVVILNCFFRVAERSFVYGFVGGYCFISLSHALPNTKVKILCAKVCVK